MVGPVFQLSTPSRISMGHCFAQMPQEMHLEGTASGAVLTPQPSWFFPSLARKYQLITRSGRS